jgi:hypothetical protein
LRINSWERSQMASSFFARSMSAWASCSVS